eukprot:gene1438-biopygen13857
MFCSTVIASFGSTESNKRKKPMESVKNLPLCTVVTAGSYSRQLQQVVTAPQQATPSVAPNNWHRLHSSVSNASRKSADKAAPPDPQTRALASSTSYRARCPAVRAATLAAQRAWHNSRRRSAAKRRVRNASVKQQGIQNPLSGCSRPGS